MVEVVKGLEALLDSQLKREGEAVYITPPPGPEEAEVLSPLKPGLLAALRDGEEVAGEELWEPYRLAALLVGLFPPPEGPVELAAYRTPYPSERVAVPQGDLVPHLLWRAHNAPKPERLWLGATAGKWTLDIELPSQVLILALSKELGTEVLFLTEDRAQSYLRARKASARPPEELWVQRVDWGRWQASMWGGLGQEWLENVVGIDLLFPFEDPL